MLDTVINFFTSRDFLPHGYCLQWFPGLLWSIVISDAIIALAYYSIPLALLYFLRKLPKLQFRAVLVMFVAFILACGTGHIIEIVNIWQPIYRVHGLIKVITATVSIFTALALWTLLPRIIDYINTRASEQQDLKSKNQMLEQSLALLQQRSGELSHLNRVSAMMQAAQNTDELLSIVRDGLHQVNIAKAGALFLIEQGAASTRARYTWGEIPESRWCMSTNSCWALRLGREYPSTADNAHVHCDHYAEEGDVPHICIPMVAFGESVGLVHLEDLIVKDESTLAIIRALVEQTAMLISNLRLREKLVQQSIRDPITGLFNRRFFDETKFLEEKRSDRNRANFVLAVFDLDNFKHINDEYGHEAGDIVLREFGKILQSNTRQGDVACRYGGDEFVVLFTSADETAAYQRAETIRKSMAEKTIWLAGKPVGRVTVSVGIAGYLSLSGGVQAVLQAADLALYRSKNAGKNRIEVTLTDLGKLARVSAIS